MSAVSASNIFDRIREKSSDLTELCETGFSQLSGAEARLSALLGARRDLMGAPDAPHPPAEEISRRSREVVDILVSRQKERGFVEAALRDSLVERRRISSELRNVDARLNERVSRLEELEAKIAEELSEDPRYSALRVRLQELERAAAQKDAGSSQESSQAAPKAATGSLASRILGLLGLTGSPAPASPLQDRRDDDSGAKTERLRNEILGLERSVRDREGATALDVQRKALGARMQELLAAEESNRRQCELLFLEWRELQKGHRRTLTAAFAELDRCLTSQAAVPPSASAARGGNGGQRRLRDLSDLVENFRSESERLLRNCDRTFTALKRVMDLEAQLWRNPGQIRGGELDVEGALQDVAWEPRPSPNPSKEPAPDPAKGASDSENPPAEGPRRYRQIRLWREN